MKKLVLLGLITFLLQSGPARADDAQPAAPKAEAKPICVLVFDQNCKAWCAQVRPLIKELQQEYADRVFFTEFDVTDNVLPETKKQAKELGLLNWMADVRDYVPLVAFFDSRHKGINELLGPKTKKDYKDNIEKSLAHGK